MHYTKDAAFHLLIINAIKPEIQRLLVRAAPVIEKILIHLLTSKRL